MYRKLDREEINNLPLEAYNGEIKLITSREDVNEAFSHLSNENVLGFDTETQPAFNKGERYNPSILQLATEKCVYIIHLNKTNLSDPIKHILSNHNIIKSGVAIRQDIIELNRLSNFTDKSFIDLGDIARKNNIPHHGLRGLTALLLGFRISKQARISNWGTPKLSHKQLIYAATDAWVGLKLYSKFKELGFIN